MGEEFSYDINVTEQIMTLKFNSEVHKTKTFTKKAIASKYKTTTYIPEQAQKSFRPIGQDGIERTNTFTVAGCFLSLVLAIKQTENFQKRL